MSIRVRRPQTDRLELTDGDFLIVKRDLTAGEQREFLGAAARPVTLTQASAALGHVPTIELDPIAAGVATVLAYLLDWSFTDADGRPLVIADQPRAVVKAALDHIDSDAYMEVQKAILAHQTARAAAIAEEKKTRMPAIVSDRTLTSVG